MNDRSRSGFWDDYYTKNPPKVDPAKKGSMFTRQRELLDTLDEVDADYIRTRAEAARKLPSQIIGEMVRERIAVSHRAYSVLLAADAKHRSIVCSIFGKLMQVPALAH